MKRIWGAFALGLISAPLAANSDATSIQERQRVIRLVSQQTYVKGSPLANALDSRKAVQKQLMEMIYSPSPEVDEIEKLRQQEYELSLGIMRLSYQANQVAMRGLTDAEHLVYLQATYPLPPVIRLPSK